MESSAPKPVARVLAAAVLLFSALYFFYLDRAPIFVSNDEAHFSSHALSIAETGRDLNGVGFPLFVEMIDPLIDNTASTAWWQPVLFYAMAISLKVLPFTEWSIRLPTALIGVLNIALIYAVARQIFSSRVLGLVAALLLAATPGHFIMSRQALDYICPVPFALAALWCAGRFTNSGGRRDLFAAGVLLGIGTFSHVAAWAMMPLLLVIIVVTLGRSGKLGRRELLMFAAGFAVPLAAVVAWLAAHPQVLWETLGRYNLAQARSSSVAAATLPEYASLYWSYFSPSFLFFAGGSSPTQATSRAGVFLLALAPLIVIGIYRICARPRQPLSVAVLLGFLLAPLPIVIIRASMPESAIAQAIMLVPFGVLLATHGVELLGRSPSGRVVAAVLVIGIPVQFTPFLADYFRDYQVRAAPRFDALNTRDVAGFVLARDKDAPVPMIYLSDDLDSKAVRWRFHLWKADRRDLFERTRYFSEEELRRGIPAGSLLVFFPIDPWIPRLLEKGFVRAATIPAPDGEASAIILSSPRQEPRAFNQ